MTFGRPPAIPNEYVQLDLPLCQSLERLARTNGNLTAAGSSDPPDTVCLFVSTMYVLKLLTRVS